MAIKLVTFDALHTLVTPRLPVYVQYSQTFAPYLGVLEPDALKQSFKSGTPRSFMFQPASNLYLGQHSSRNFHVQALKRGGSYSCFRNAERVVNCGQLPYAFISVKQAAKANKPSEGMF